MKEYTTPEITVFTELASTPENNISLMGNKTYTGCSGSGQYSCDPWSC